MRLACVSLFCRPAAWKANYLSTLDKISVRALKRLFIRIKRIFHRFIRIKSLFMLNTMQQRDQ